MYTTIRKSFFLICAIGRFRLTQTVLWSAVLESIQNGWIFNLDESFCWAENELFLRLKAQRKMIVLVFPSLELRSFV